jgi:hypothetical protein
MHHDKIPAPVSPDENVGADITKNDEASDLKSSLSGGRE